MSRGVGDDRAWRKLRRKVVEIASRDAHVRVGVLGEEGGAETHEGGITMVELAAIHEFGSPAAGIPERSFIRRTFNVKQKELAEVTAKLAKAVVEDRMTVPKALDVLGAWGAAEIRKTVTEGDHIPPPLQPATKDRKGSDRPLVDTGRMINAVQWKVVE